MQPKDQTDPYRQPGGRLAHILDRIGFFQGRGRMKLLHEILVSNDKYDFSDLKNTTVRAWFHQNAPSMRHINAILDILSGDYEFKDEIEHIAVWWKVGGHYPFPQDYSPVPNDERDFIITALITEEANAICPEMEISALLLIKEKMFQMYKEFANPNIKEYPKEHARMLIKGLLNSLDTPHS